jgi:hypothetical protein
MIGGMMSDLPTVEQLQRLPLRAIAAYAARAARRVRPLLQGVIDDSVVADILSIVESVVSAENFDRLDSPSVLRAAARLMGASAPIEKSDSQCLAVMCLNRAALTAYAVLQGAAEPERASYYAAYAASGAEGAASDLVALDEPAATAAAKAARADYEMLLKMLGEHDTVTVGRPIDLSEGSFLGALI